MADDNLSFQSVQQPPAPAPAYPSGADLSGINLSTGQPYPQSPEGPVKKTFSQKLLGLLSNFRTGMGEAMMVDAGVQTPAQRQSEAVKQAYTKAMIENMATDNALNKEKFKRIPVMLNGQDYNLPEELATRILLAQEATRRAGDTARIRADQTQMVAFPKHLADAMGMPELAGKMAKLSDVNGAMRSLGITSTQVTTDQGVFDYDEISGSMKRLGGLAPSYRPLQDPVSGAVTGTFNSKTGAVTGDGRLNSLPGPELTRRGMLQVMSDDIKTLEGLAQRNPNKIGALAGRFSSLLQQTVGDTNEAVDLFRLSDNMADQLLRARSGAQINEQEYQRLRKFVPDPRTPYSTYMERLKSFSNEIGRMQEYTSTPRGPAQPSASSKRILKFNPSTGRLE